MAFVFASITLCAQSKEEVALNNLAVSLMDKGDYKEGSGSYQMKGSLLTAAFNDRPRTSIKISLPGVA